MTMLTSTIAWCTRCVERARRARSSILDVVSHLIGSSSESFHNHLHTIHGAPSLTRFSLSTSTCSFLPFSVHFLHSELYSELDNPIVMESLCYSANKESEDAYDVSTSLTKTQRHKETKTQRHKETKRQRDKETKRQERRKKRKKTGATRLR